MKSIYNSFRLCNAVHYVHSKSYKYLLQGKTTALSTAQLQSEPSMARLLPKLAPQAFQKDTCCEFSKSFIWVECNR